MKRIQNFLLIAMCLILGTSAAMSAELNSREKAAQKAVGQYLKSQDFSIKLDDSDNSVNFKYKGNLFWVTFEERGNGIIYTLHRAPLNMTSEKQDANTNARRLEICTIASNMMNVRNVFKTYVKGEEVDFVFPVYAANPDEYIKVFPSVLRSMENAKESFDNCYDRAKMKADSIHDYWTKNDPNVIVVPQQRLQGTSNSGPNLTVTSVDFQVLDSNGAVVSGYGQSIRKSDIRYIQPRLTVAASKKGIYHIGMVIITPNGKTLLPSVKDNRTTMTTVEVEKKAEAVELTPFGSKDGKFWQAGEYKVYFYENGHKLKETSFTIL